MVDTEAGKSFSCPMDTPTEDSITLWKTTDSQLRGSARRKFRAGVVKAVVKIGNFSRGGHSRQHERALDHDFGAEEKLTPYHSKYSPVERSWGGLENHWRGQLLESIEKAVGMARSMTYAGVKPVVKLVRRVYQSGVKVAKCDMGKIESILQRKAGLGKWFMRITPETTG